MLYNNKTCSTIIAFALLFLLMQSVQPTSKKHAKEINDLDSLVLKQEEEANFLSVQIGHRPARMQATLNNGRSWIKEGFCKICDQATGQCEQSCFDDDQQIKLSCDSSFCDKLDEFKDEQRGIEGVQGQVFMKVSNNIQVLMNLIFATKLYEKHEELGKFNIFDSDSSFSNGILIKNNHNNLELLNVQRLSKQDLTKYQQNEGSLLHLPIEGTQLNFDFLKVKQLNIHNMQFDKYKNVTIPVGEFSIEFSLQSQSIDLPAKLFRKLENQLVEQYFANQSCKFLPKKLKCTEQIHLEPLYESFFEISVNQYTLSLPFHLIFTACSKNQCRHLLNTHSGSQTTVTVGTIVWSIFNLEYNADEKWFNFYRKKNQWSSLYSSQSRINPEKIGFFRALIGLIYHIFLVIFKIIFILGILSLIINCVIHWRKVLGWIKLVLLRVKQRRKGHRLEDNEGKDYFSGGKRRKIHRLPDYQEDLQGIV